MTVLCFDTIVYCEREYIVPEMYTIIRQPVKMHLSYSSANKSVYILFISGSYLPSIPLSFPFLAKLLFSQSVHGWTKSLRQGKQIGSADEISRQAHGRVTR